MVYHTHKWGIRNALKFIMGQDLTYSSEQGSWAEDWYILLNFHLNRIQGIIIADQKIPSFVMAKHRDGIVGEMAQEHHIKGRGKYPLKGMTVNTLFILWMTGVNLEESCLIKLSISVGYIWSEFILLNSPSVSNMTPWCSCIWHLILYLRLRHQL